MSFSNELFVCFRSFGFNFLSIYFYCCNYSVLFCYNFIQRNNFRLSRFCFNVLISASFNFISNISLEKLSSVEPVSCYDFAVLKTNNIFFKCHNSIFVLFVYHVFILCMILYFIIHLFLLENH